MGAANEGIFTTYVGIGEGFNFSPHCLIWFIFFPSRRLQRRTHRESDSEQREQFLLRQRYLVVDFSLLCFFLSYDFQSDFETRISNEIFAAFFPTVRDMEMELITKQHVVDAFFGANIV